MVSLKNIASAFLVLALGVASLGDADAASRRHKSHGLQRTVVGSDAARSLLTATDDDNNILPPSFIIPNFTKPGSSSRALLRSAEADDNDGTDPFLDLYQLVATFSQSQVKYSVATEARVTQLEDYLFKLAETTYRKSSNIKLAQSGTSFTASVTSPPYSFDQLSLDKLDPVQAKKEIDTEITTLITPLGTRLTAEENRAKAAEAGLQNAINTEVARAGGAESDLDKRITGEVGRAKGAETDLLNSINKEVARAGGAESDLDKRITAEVGRATTAETGLDTAIKKEVARAGGAESDLDKRITAEVGRATTAEAGLDNAIKAEATRAGGAENSLDSKISTEETRAKGIEAGLAARIAILEGILKDLSNKNDLIQLIKTVVAGESNKGGCIYGKFATIAKEEKDIGALYSGLGGHWHDNEGIPTGKTVQFHINNEGN